MASLKFRHYATESALKGNGTVQNALNAFDVGTIVFIDDMQKQYIITSKSNNVVTYKIYYGEAAVIGISGSGATREFTFSDGSVIDVKINDVEHAISADAADTAKSVDWNNVSGIPTNFVTTDNTQTITGAKTFTNNVSLQGSTNADSITTEDLIVNGAARFVSGLTGDLKGDVVGNVTGNVTGNVSGSSGSCTGNALTATTLQTARSINGTSFNGSQAITTAKWGTARTITIADNTNEHTQANNNIDGSANFTLKLPTTIKADIIGNASTANSAKSVDWANVINTPNLVTTDTEQTITGAKIFNNNTTFKNETDIESLMADSLLVTGSARFTNTINGNLKGNVEGNLTGNASTATTAATATEFSTNKAVTLTGDVTGSTSSKGGWSVATTIANGAVTNAKLANSKITIAGTDVSLGGSIAASTIGNALTSDAPAAYATNAGTATKAGEADKATKDSDGNIINTTYLKKSGGTVTGALILNDATTVNSTLTANNITADNLTINGAAKFNGGLEGNLKGDVDGNATTATTCTGNATTATTATNLASKPSGLFTAATSSADASLTITAGGKTSDAITIGKVKSAFTADSATTATSCSGNAETATTLQNTRKINGTDFNGSADITTSKWGTARNITISDGTNSGTATSVDGSGAITLNLPGTIKANLSGNASTATKATNADRATGDSDGNAINTTYLKRSGGTVTGNVTFNSSVTADSITTEDLIVNGASRFISGITGDLVGNVTGNVTGNLSGNASSATKATNDGNGNTITSTYATKTERSNNDITAASLNATKLTLTRAAGNITANIPTWNQDTTGTAAKATADAKGNNIVNTYATKAEVAALPKSMVIKGTLDSSHSLPTSGMTEGDTYIVGASGTYNKIACKVGDFFVRTSDSWLRIPAGDEWEYNENTIKAIKVNNAGHADTAGTATTAGSATSDSNGNNIVNTYARIDKVYDDSDTYRMFLGKNGSSSDWIRTTESGIIPYTSGDASNGHSSLGTSSWYFSKAYIQNIYGYLNGNISGSSTSCSGNAATATTATNVNGGYGNLTSLITNNIVMYPFGGYGTNTTSENQYFRIKFGTTFNEGSMIVFDVVFRHYEQIVKYSIESYLYGNTNKWYFPCVTALTNIPSILNEKVFFAYDSENHPIVYIKRTGGAYDQCWVENIHVGHAGKTANFNNVSISNVDGIIEGDTKQVEKTPITWASNAISADIATSAISANTATKAGYLDTGTMTLYAHNSNEINFGGTSTSSEIYVGYRATDSKPIPTKFIFGGSTGTATLTAGGFKKKDSSSSYVLTGDGGHAAISGLSVKYATSAGTATTAGDANTIGGISTSKLVYGSNSTKTTDITEDQLNAPLASGFYTITNTTTGSGATIPNATSVSMILHTSYSGLNNNAGFDLLINDSITSSLHFRPATGSGKGAWKTLIDTGNIGLQSVNYATTSGACTGNAATATKATQDSDGNAINTTYLKRSGGTVTGNVTFNSSVTTDSLTTEDLIVNGSARFVSGLTGDLVGNASSATYATRAGNADSAVSAVNDGNGNSIDDTYLKKSGGTMDLNGYPALRLKTYQIQSFEINSQNNNPAVVSFSRDGSLGYLGFYEANNPIYVTNSGTRYSLVHAGNISSQSVNYATTSGSCSGNAATATKLQTARTIWGQSFDGSRNVSGKISNVGDIIPATTHVSNLGSSSLVWERLYGRYIDTDSTYYLRLCAGGTEVVTITDPSGGSNVGIGTASPTSKLHVAGTGYFTGDTSSAANIIAGGYIKGETVKISSGCTLEYSSTDKCVRFVFN